ncbi:non-homologous end-joining DNA ligase [Sporolactobacillus sp. STCC-11]|uniref:non-homologous end-joining DNA ligase n=1 Tax=Sporolactobacillus caesalpiniae TaxID=3230362 RepID=UPI003396C647
MNLQPIVPFEPIRKTAVPTGAGWVHQVKWDGVRILTYYDGQEVRLFNRRQNERTDNYPELTKINQTAKASSLILDGEVIALDAHGRPSFHEIMKRDSIRNSARVHLLMAAVPIDYMVFDLIYCNGQWVNDRPFSERTELLKQWLPTNERIHIVPTYEDGEALLEKIKERHMEGIVSKRLDSTYAINRKSDHWIKIKVTHDLIAVVGGVTYRGTVVNALLLGLYASGGQLVYIGHAGTGKLTRADWLSITNSVEKMKIEKRPFLNQPDRNTNAKWIEPKLTVKVAFQEWTAGRVLRQPSIQAFVQVDPKRCTIEEMDE